MCGIAGIIGPDGSPPPAAELERLLQALHHRGPDARGQLVRGGVGLAHTRLSIIDLSENGAQPMQTPDGRFAFVYNGEVYGFARLRAELERRGERFAGRSDTEVVLRLLALDGPEALGRLDGMFALALHDTRTGDTWLARDRMGQKPLYVARREGGGFAFASELLPLLAVPGVDASIDPEGLSWLLTFGFVPAPWTLRRGIRQLLPGTRVRLRHGGPFEAEDFVSPPGPREPSLRGDLDTLSRQLESVLDAAVRDHLVADVPVGVLLSGGVDSSAVAALATRHAATVKTFSVVHADPAYDERDAARAVANAIGSDHHEIELSDAPLSEGELDVLVDHHGDPFADSSSLAVLRLSREMRRHVTVALSGDGADELFAGYPRFGELRALSRLGLLPRPLLGFGRAACRALPGATPRRLARALLIAGMPRARRPIALTSLFWPEEQARLLRPEWQTADADQRLEGLLAARGADLSADAVDSAHWLEQRLILPDDMLTKVDRMSMATALEIRPPILANDVLDFSMALPFEAKSRGMTGKRVLRALARRLVPSWVVDRPKQGFSVPLEQHGGAVFREASRFALESEASPLRELFRPEALAGLARSLHVAGEGRDPEDSPYRRVHRRWLLTLLARSLARHGGP